MLGRRHQFRGQFGINETPLTKAIQQGSVKAAEELVRKSIDPSLLNDGSYEHTPLRLSLVPTLAPSRQLRLARLLVESGADPNLRLVQSGELDHLSPSSFQELVVYYELLRAEVSGCGQAFCDQLGIFFQCEEDRIAFLTKTVDLDGVASQTHSDSCPHLLEHTRELISIFLEYGSDPNVATTFGHKSLFHWVVEQGDISLTTEMLSTLRVNLDCCDLHGNTALMDAILVLTPDECLDLYKAMKRSGHRLNLNATNCCGETSLFRAAFVGAAGLAARLVSDGATATAISTPGQNLMSCPTACNPDHRMMMSLLVSQLQVTPLLTPLLADAPPRLRYSSVPGRELGTCFARPHKHLIDKIVAAAVSPMVDLGCLNDPTSMQYLNTLLIPTNFRHLDTDPRDLQVLMFGQISAGLRQLCVRKIFDQVFPDIRNEVPEQGGIGNHVYCGYDCEGALSQTHIVTAVEALGLPQPLSIFFEVEAAKYQVCGLVTGLQTLECDSACSDSDDSVVEETDDEITDDTSDFSDYADSLLFFSSDMLSEESSSELEDLSEEEGDSDDECNEKFENPEGDEASVEKESKKTEAQPARRKVQPDFNFASESKIFRGVVEVFCEDVAEGSLQIHIPTPPPDAPTEAADPPSEQETHYRYQRFNDESTASTISALSNSPSPSNPPTPSDPPSSYDPPSPSDPPSDSSGK